MEDPGKRAAGGEGPLLVVPLLPFGGKRFITKRHEAEIPVIQEKLMGVREFCKGDVDTWPRHHYCLRIPDKI